MGSTAGRTVVVTGAASGIGAATARLLADRSWTVITADLTDADVCADLSQPAGRTELVRAVAERCGGRLDAVCAIAGLATPTAQTVAVNFFGMRATLTGLRPLLAEADAGRAVGVASISALMPSDTELVAMMLDHDEPQALSIARSIEDTDRGRQIYASTKRAFAMWVRDAAASDEWAGSGIALNAVAPGVVDTPMSQAALADPGARAAAAHIPSPLGGVAPPEAIANAIAWLVEPETTHVCGQVLFVDGGYDAAVRGARAW